jgi:uncharacterized membrane-anchored protein
MERLGQLIDSGKDAPQIAPPIKIVQEKPAQDRTVETKAQTENPATSAPIPGREAPVIATEFAAGVIDAEPVEEAAESVRLPDDPGVEPSTDDEKTAPRFRLF